MNAVGADGLRHVRFEVVGLTVEVSFPETLQKGMHPLVCSYEVSNKSPELCFFLRSCPDYHLRGGQGGDYDADTAEDLLWEFELRLQNEILEYVRPLPSLHAAGISRSGVGLLLTGESGAGKTTLCHAMLERRFDYLSEEWMVFDSDLRARGIPRPFHFVSDTARQDGSKTVVAPTARVEYGPVEVAALVVLKRSSFDVPNLRHLDKVELLAVLQNQLLSVGQRPLEALSDLLDRLAAFELTYSGIEDACHLLERLLVSAERRAQ
jgi:hypothetical protein